MTLHLTSGCNMRCGYCYAPPTKRRDMSEETVAQAIQLSTRLNPVNTGIIFFGGEPLLRKDLIRSAIARCRDNERRHGYSYHFKVTTNGLLLDQNFLEYAKTQRLQIGLSIDGTARAHDRHRLSKTGRPTFARLQKKIAMLLAYQPYAYALMTVTPETVADYTTSVEYLLNAGFRYIIASINHAGEWQDAHLKILRGQYTRLAKLYEKLTLAGKKFYFSPFEKKLASHIQGADALCQQCHFGVKQISIAPDGTIFPCVQFVRGGDDKTFAMGDVCSGIDSARQQSLYALSRQTTAVCDACALTNRCEHRCSCLNWQTTGAIDQIAPSLCETERLLIPIVDRLGERLYKKKAAYFIQKHYNAAYPFISFLEDNLVSRS